jgi:hypothetical protein
LPTVKAICERLAGKRVALIASGGNDSREQLLAVLSGGA